MVVAKFLKLELEQSKKDSNKNLITTNGLPIKENKATDGSHCFTATTKNNAKVMVSFELKSTEKNVAKHNVNLDCVFLLI